VLWTAYGWGKPRIGVVLTEGTSEIELASVLDVYPGPVLTANTTTLTPEGPRSPVRTEHGLYFFPRSDLDSEPGFDRLLVTGGTAPSVTDPRVRSWARERPGTRVHPRTRAGGLPLRRNTLGSGQARERIGGEVYGQATRVPDRPSRPRRGRLAFRVPAPAARRGTPGPRPRRVHRPPPRLGDEALSPLSRRHEHGRVREACREGSTLGGRDTRSLLVRQTTGGRPCSDIGCLQVGEAPKSRRHGVRRDESVWTSTQ